MPTVTLSIDFVDFNDAPSEKQQVSSMAHTLYANQRAAHRMMTPWRNASKAVKREFMREARQVLGLV